MARKVKFKTGPLTNKEKAYIEKNKGVLSPEDIASKLKRRVEAVLRSLNKPSEPEPVVTTKEPKQMDFLLAKRPDRGVVVMTEAASMHMDEVKRTRKSNLDPSFVHKIREDK